MKQKPVLLVRAALQGDQEAFAQLVNQHRQCMYATAMAVTRNEPDALDAIQETVLTLWLKLYTLKDPVYFKTWMTRILVNQCCSILQKSRRESPMDILPEETAENDQDTPLDVAAAMKRLCADDKLILQLFYFEDLSIAQIGEVLGVSPGAVRMRLSRGRKRFLAQYTEEPQEVRYEK